jgi:septal ring factor EnvC (AmiA/AmiB activator)
MSETENRSEPHVSGEELRAALAPRAETRRNPVLVAEHSEHAEGEIASLRSAIDASRADAIELRAALDAARGDAAELRAELASVRVDLRERRAALEKLASAGIFRRRKVLAELSSRNLV